MTYERNFDLLNRKFRELFFPTLMVSIAGNFAVLVDAFFISMFMGSTYLSVVQSIEPFVAFINVIYWLIGWEAASYALWQKQNLMRRKEMHISRFRLLES